MALNNRELIPDSVVAETLSDEAKIKGYNAVMTEVSRSSVEEESQDKKLRRTVVEIKYNDGGSKIIYGPYFQLSEVLDEQGNVVKGQFIKKKLDIPVDPPVTKRPPLVERPLLKREHTGILDNDWSIQAFLLSDEKLNKIDRANRYWSTANWKFTDTRYGGNIGVNAKPQFNRYSDIRVKGILSDRNDVSVSNANGNYGMGRYYSEAIDDPEQTVYLRFGVPKHNTLTNYLLNLYDADHASNASKGFIYNTSKIAGNLFSFALAPYISTFIVASKQITSFFARGSSKFYTLEPDMLNYWSTVTHLVNVLAINRGTFALDEDDPKIGKPLKINKAHVDQLEKNLPDMFRGGYIDVYSLSNKAQRIANAVEEERYQFNKNIKVGSKEDKELDGYLRTTYKKSIGSDEKFGKDKGPSLGVLDKKPTIRETMNHYLQMNRLLRNTTAGLAAGAVQTAGTIANHWIGDDSTPKNVKGLKSKKNTDDPVIKKEAAFTEHLDAEFRDGSAFAVFRVEHTGSVSESFSNSAVESSLTQKLNSQSSNILSTKFDLAGGKITDLPVIVEDILKGATSVIKGVLDGASFGLTNIVFGLAGNGFIEVPKHWDSSSVNLPKSTYTMKLITPYNNPISIAQNIDTPLCMLLAGTLPKALGKQSYGSPFICQLFDRGRLQIPLGIIDSLSITRGTSNLPFDTEGTALAIDVSFSVMDLSTIMNMPVPSGDVAGYDNTLDEDSGLSDYFSVISGQDIYNQIYTYPRTVLSIEKYKSKFKQFGSTALKAQIFKDTTTSNILAAIGLGLPFKALDALSPGSAVTTSK